MTTAAETAHRLGAKCVGKDKYLGTCPVCEYPKAFSITQGRTQALFACHAGCDRDQLLAALGYGCGVAAGLNGTLPQGFRVTRRAAEPDDTERTAAARALLERSLPGAGTPVETYLRSRGLMHHPALRFLPDHRHAESGRTFAVMIAPVNRGSDVVAVHRTFIAEDGRGKAQVEPAKKSLGPLRGGAVYLDPPGEQLVVAEGLETALSVRQELGLPTWSALSAGGIRSLVLPPLPLAQTIVVAADADPVGVGAARFAANRWALEGRKVRVMVPPKAGQDFNDVLLDGEALNEVV